MKEHQRGDKLRRVVPVETQNLWLLLCSQGPQTLWSRHGDEKEPTGMARTEMLWGFLGLGGGMMPVRDGKAGGGTKAAGNL